MAFALAPAPSQPVAFSQSRQSSVNGKRGVSSRGARASGSIVESSSFIESFGRGQVSPPQASWSRRPTSATSPTESVASGCSSSCVPTIKAAPANTFYGFNVGGTASSSLQEHHAKSKATGLLSKALVGTPEDAALPLLSPTNAAASSLSAFLSGFSAPSSHAAFFPDVDVTLLEQARERHDVFNSELVTNAYMIAARAYNGQMRQDRSSVLAHCMLTALTLADFGLDAQTVACGLLMEVLRNNEAFRSQLEEFMPTEVVRLVDRVTTISHISDIYREHRSDMDDEKLRQMILAMEDVKAVLVTLAARVHDMKSINSLQSLKRQQLAQETLDIFSVVANRLGCWCLKAELEDLAFQSLHPEEYEHVKAQVRSRQDPAALEATIQAIKAGLDQQGIKYADISGRPKNLYGIWQKMVNDGVTNVDKIYDVIALRVVVQGNKHDCYYAQRVVQQLYRCMPERSKDFIKVIKKANGYQSLHETIYGASDMPIEVQIRTHKMHYIAEYGFAAHWKYKENLNNDDEWLDKEVQYKKWLMNYKLGVHDKKVRPSGSPPTDSSLKSLGAHYLDMSANPELAAKVDPFLMHDRFKLQAPSRQTVRVMLQTQDSVEQRECLASVSVDELERELDIASLPGYVMTVNNKLPSDKRSALLRDGDLVQIMPLSQLLSRSPPERQPGLAEMAGSPPRQQPESAPAFAGFWAAAAGIAKQQQQQQLLKKASPKQQQQQQQPHGNVLEVFSLGSTQPVSVVMGFSAPSLPIPA